MEDQSNSAVLKKRDVNKKVDQEENVKQFIKVDKGKEKSKRKRHGEKEVKKKSPEDEDYSTDDEFSEDEGTRQPARREDSILYMVVRYLLIFVVFLILQKLLFGRDPFGFGNSDNEKVHTKNIEAKIRAQCDDPYSDVCTETVNKVLKNLKESKKLNN